MLSTSTAVRAYLPVGWWLALLLFGIAVAEAQVVEVPTFTVGSAPAGHIVRDLDVTVGIDGKIVLVWDEYLPTSHLARTLLSRLYTSPGVPFAPAVPIVSGSFVGFDAPRAIGVPSGVQLPTRPEIDPRFPGGYLVARIATQGTCCVGANALDAMGNPAFEYGMQIDDGQTINHGTDLATARLPTGVAFTWWDEEAADLGNVRLRLYRSSALSQPPVDLASAVPLPYVDLAGRPDDGIVAAWGAPGGGAARAMIQVLEADLTPRGPAFPASATSVLRRIAVSPRGDVIAAIGTRPESGAEPNELWARRFDLDGVPLEPEFLVDATAPGTPINGDVSFDGLGNLYVLWSAGGALRVRAWDENGTAAGPAVTIGNGAGAAVRTERLDDGTLLNAWVVAVPAAAMAANSVTTCVPGSTVCGDGVRDSFCEACDAGVANSDVVPDACRTSCRLPRCGDQVVDSGETCDDGNIVDCDGCSRTCAVEIGVGCGDGVPFPSCGELCDDGNAIEGDGCSPSCTLERVPGGGSAARDCYTEWSVDNPANDPLRDKHGAFRNKQACVDDDPRCDFDGGTPGSCLFHLRACVNNTNLAACAPPNRVLSWELMVPSEKAAASDPVNAGVRAAVLGTVPSTIVGTENRDFCSPLIDVPVALRGTPSAYAARTVKIKTSARHSDRPDLDTLTLRCRPAD